MSQLVQAKVDDEISELIARLRDTSEDEVGLVIPGGNRAFQTPLNVRLLRQFAKQSGKRTSIISDDARVQQLARMSGFPTFGSVPAFEHGSELTAVAPPPPPRVFREDDLGSAVATAPPQPPPLDTTGAAGAATAVAEKPPASPSATRTYMSRVPPTDEAPPPRNRRPLYFAAAGVAVLGLVLFLLLSPSATITMTVAATPLSVNPTIQGTTDPSAGSQGDHVLTQVVTTSAQNQFQATPTGQQTLPATPASGTETISSSFAVEGTIPAGTQFESGDANHSTVFGVTKDTYVCVGPNGPPPGCSHAANSQVPIQDENPGSSGNVSANTLTYWPPSQQPAQCMAQPGPSLCSATNGQAASGGADQKQVTDASSTDVANWNQQVQQLENQLTAQLKSEMQSKAAGKKPAIDPGQNGQSITFTVTPQVPSAGSQFSPAQITVAGNATGVFYDPNQVRSDVLADLQAQVPQGFQLAAGKLSMQPVVVTQSGTDGTVVLSVSASDFSQPLIDIEGLKGQLSGKNPGDAQRIISSRIDKVQNVQVSEFPFGLPYLPFFSSRIQIDENFVPLSPSS